MIYGAFLEAPYGCRVIIHCMLPPVLLRVYEFVLIEIESSTLIMLSWP